MQRKKIAFFGTPDIAVWVLEELKQADILPDLIVTNPDRKQGRGLALAPTPVKAWANQQSIPVFTPENLKDAEGLTPITTHVWDLFIVVAYGHIMPKWFIELPKYGTVNVHPSLLPKLRGASPIRTSLLNNMKDMGVTIMLMDERMDHGPILAQESLQLDKPLPGMVLDQKLARMGGKLLVQVIPELYAGTITPKEQNHEEATYSTKITKDMGELALDPFNLPTEEEAYAAYLKICAFDGWPGTFFFYNKKRVKITEADFDQDNQLLVIRKVIPEGKKETDFGAFLQSVTQR